MPAGPSAPDIPIFPSLPAGPTSPFSPLAPGSPGSPFTYDTLKRHTDVEICLVTMSSETNKNTLYMELVYNLHTFRNNHFTKLYVM